MKSIKCIAFIFRVYKTETIVLRACNGLSRSRVWVNVLYLRETDSEAGRKSIDIVRWWLMMTHSTHTWYIIVRAPTWEGVITGVCVHVLCDVLNSSHHRILHKPHQHLAHSRNYRPKDVYFNISKRLFYEGMTYLLFHRKVLKGGSKIKFWGISS